MADNPTTPSIEIQVCSGTSCVSRGSLDLRDALCLAVRKQSVEGKVRVIASKCLGFCAAGPMLVTHPNGQFFHEIQPEDADEFIEELLLKGGSESRYLFKPPENKSNIPKISEVPFYSNQLLVTLRNRGLIDPKKIDEYIARDGYQAAAKALTQMTPTQIVEEMINAGIRGRGGGGFPTGMKWQFCADAPGPNKYILCNADEGDPGAFMDRSVLESDPHAVIEGMIIGARAIGASQGYIYVRSEYPLAIEHLEIAIAQAREYGLLGNDILGSGFDMDIDLYLGAGAFVCGEETALMQSIQGMRGMPRPRPPYPALKGLWDCPTVLNNVETFANVPQIILRGAPWFASIGTEKSKGTKVFALSGCVKNIGLIEVPMGTTLRQIVEDIGGGAPGRHRIKAVQVGGPSGGCLPERKLDTPIDYESIMQTGAIIGSGGMVVMDETSCMVDVAKFFLEFTADESCGKCTPCREGTQQMLGILTRITNGKGQPEDIEILEELAQTLQTASLCGLGQTAPNPVLTTIRYFRDEYEAHIHEGRCPAHKCKALLKYEVRPETCKRCGLCFKACPTDAISWEKKQVATIDRKKCIECGACYAVCPFDAIL